MALTIEELSKRASDIQKVADEIVIRYHGISSLHEAATWKSDAIALQNLITLFQQDINKYKSYTKALLQQEENKKKDLSFFKKLTSSKESEKKYRENIQQAQGGIDSIEHAKSSLAEKILEIPTSKAELKQKIDELNIHKKELTIDKRTVTEEMRQIRTSARQARSQLAGISRGTMGRIASYQRAMITRGRENKLSPLENAKAEIEYQLIETEKQINRLKSIKIDEEINIESRVLRCSYCGRRVNPGEVCPGCGSDKTTYELNK